MFSLQAELDERLVNLRNKKSKNKKSISLSKESIEMSLKQAGILNDKGKIIKRVA